MLKSRSSFAKHLLSRRKTNKRWRLCKLLALCIFVHPVTMLKVLRPRSLKKRGRNKETLLKNQQPELKPVGEEKKKPRPKYVFGRPLPTEEEFEILKNAPRLETGAPARVKPFGV